MKNLGKVTTHLPLAAIFVAVGAVAALPFQAANAQQDTNFIVRLVQGTAQTGLVNVSVQVGNVIVSDVIDVTRNNIAVVLQVPIDADLALGAQVCATILSSGDQVCKFKQDIEQGGNNRVSLNLRQAQ